jgi:hypothetical protein
MPGVDREHTPPYHALEVSFCYFNPFLNNIVRRVIFNIVFKILKLKISLELKCTFEGLSWYGIDGQAHRQPLYVRSFVKFRKIVNTSTGIFLYLFYHNFAKKIYGPPQILQKYTSAVVAHCGRSR